jgi:catechol 2,3-dioxygenase-like lactoylglutathione lyase family enzyme
VLTLAGALLAMISTAAAATQLHHVHLATPSTSESVKWYARHLGCEPVEGRPKVVECGGMAIEFVAGPTLGSSQGTGVNHISLSYPDVRAKMDELEAVGVGGAGVRLQRFEDGSTIRSYAGLFDHGFIFDPWGTRIELVQVPNVIGFHHVHLESLDPEATLTWYAETMGGERSQYGGKLDGVLFDGVWLLADRREGDSLAPTDLRAVDHLSFVADDLPSLAEQLKEQGIDMQAPTVPEGARSDAKRAFLSGPDGVLIALVETHWAGVEDVQQMAADADATAPYKSPMTPWGEPDMQGLWTGNAAHGIPLERPEDVADADALTPEEAAARRERGTLGSIWGYEREWRDTTLGYDKLAPSTQVAMVIDPPDGRLPPLTEKGAAAVAAIADARANPKLAGGPEDLSTWVRCITRGLPQMMMPGVYNNGMQIVQSPGYVAIQKEMIHETRLIPTTEKPAPSPKIRQWLGNSRGRWEGDTLVVEVTGFNGRVAYRGAGAEMTMTERYRRVGPDTLEYRFTVDDPTIWTAPWTGMFHFKLDDDQYELVEYACHEGNYGMTNILSGARAREQEDRNPAGDD